MEDNFRVRIDKAFGSLASPSSSPTPAYGSSLWCLTDDEIERNEWNREEESTEGKGEDSLVSKKGDFISHREKSQKDLELELEKDLEELDDDLEDEQSGASSSQLEKTKPNDYNEEEWEIENSIGMDCTLDYEEEEDQFDKVAVGKEKVDEWLYNKDVIDYGVDIDSNSELPSSLKDIPKDPRANHVAAKLRLKEDAEAAKKMDSLRVSEQDSTAVVDDQQQVKSSENGNIKSILKRREDDSDSKSKHEKLESKSKKRVRFDPECKDEDDDEVTDVEMETDSTDKSLTYPLPPDYPSGIPDYMRNPSKYTHYTFDSLDDVDEQSNKHAFMDFLKMLKKPDDAEPQQAGELPKSVTFIPKKKASDSVMPDAKQKGEEASNRKGLLAAADDDDAEESELCAMDEDEIGTPAERRKSSEKPARRYRRKPELETDEAT